MRRDTRLRGAVALLAGAALAATTCVSCSGSADSDKVTLTWARPGSHDVVSKTFNPILKKFEQQNPNIEVDIVEMGFDESVERLPVMAATGELPDVFMPSTHLLYRLADSNALMPLDDHITGKTRSSIYESLWESSTYDGKTYGIPANVGPIVMWYNADLFKEAGLDPDKPPTDWQGLLKVAQTVEKKTKADGIGLNGFARNDIVDLFAALVAAESGKWFWDAKSDNLRDDPAMEDALDFLRTLVKKEATQPNVDQYNRADTRSLLRDGKTAITFDGPWVMPVLSDVADPTSKDSPFQTAALPGTAKSTSISIDSWVAAAGTEHPDETLKLLDFLTTTQNQLAHSDGYGVLPPMRDLVKKKQFQRQPWNTFAVSLDNGYPTKPPVAKMSLSDSTIPEAVQGAMLGNATSRQALADLKADIKAAR